MGSALTNKCFPNEGVSLAQEHEVSMEHMELAKVAETLREIYELRYAFPEWSIRELGNGNLATHAKLVTVYYPKGSDLQDVKRLVLEREPVNIGMRRRYNKEKMKAAFGYATGAYGSSTVEKLMPNIAIYCKTPMRSSNGQNSREVHVINVIGYAFDRQMQPDYQYFFSDDEGKRDELLEKMGHMWEYIYFCAREKHLKRVYLAQVGGGAFSFLLGGSFDYATLRAESLEPVKARYPEIETMDLPMIPDWVFSKEGEQNAATSLLVNAWDPWSMVGNGNAGDNSLDGFYGRCTAMAVLCWPLTNPYLNKNDRYRQMPP